jgi:outer membrane protein assembly factor BamB
MTVAPDVTTYHYDLSRDGLNSQETILTQANVNSTTFGKIGNDPVDGKVDAEPLFLANLTVGGAPHNVLYVATEHGSVYAFDADTNTQLWMTSVIPTGETTSDDHNCNQISTEIGITSTPIIDRKQGPNGTIFVVGMSKDTAGRYHQRLHALDITTGTEIAGSPTEIAASFPGTGDNSQGGNVVFDPSQYAERAALTLLNGNIYMGFTSHCDAGLFTGWVMAYSESTLQQTQLLNLTPNGHAGSIWMSGNGLAVDSSNNIYLLDANGTFDTTLDVNNMPVNSDFGNAMLKISTVNGKLAVADYFETFNTVSESSQDVELGSGGQVLLPDMTDSTGKVRHLIVGAGKDKNIYLADRDNLGKFSSATSPINGNVYQQVAGQLAGPNFTTPAYFNNVLYFASDGDTLKAFPLTNAMLATAPSSASTATFAHPGSTPAVSANGTQNGIVWAVQSALTAPGVLHAYDPTNLQHEFYNSTQAPNSRDAFGNGNKFITPLVVNGKVYIGTQNSVAVFGLLPQ